MIPIKYEHSEQYNKEINELFTAKTNEVPELKELRDWVEANIFGFGERSFYWLWKLIVDEMPQTFSFLEIGVFRGQTTALIHLLAKLSGKTAHVYGITPLNSADGHWESDYAKDIKTIHDKFNLEQPNLLIGLSTNKDIINDAIKLAPFNIVYIDGGHTYEVVKSDLINYPQLAKDYLVIDDCCNDIPMPFGYFTGIPSVTKAVKEWEKTQDKFKLKFNVVHVKVYKRNASY